jgi:hypothetical protein
MHTRMPCVINRLRASARGSLCASSFGLAARSGPRNRVANHPRGYSASARGRSRLRTAPHDAMEKVHRKTSRTRASIQNRASKAAELLQARVNSLCLATSPLRSNRLFAGPSQLCAASILASCPTYTVQCHLDSGSSRRLHRESLRLADPVVRLGARTARDVEKLPPPPARAATLGRTLCLAPSWPLGADKTRLKAFHEDSRIRE